jgi:ribose transport system ATP-binding protein
LAPLVELEGVAKSFGPTRALAGVNVAFDGGEIHVLAGANGAGKSTLIRILSGVYRDYEGQIRIAGEVVHFGSPAAARAAGVATIHQELSLVPAMSVADNLALSEGGRMWQLVSPKARRAQAERALGLLGLDIDPDVAVERLPLAARQLCEVARALAREARVLVLDEATSALGESDAARLYQHLGRLRAGGAIAVVFISHRIDEIYRLADRISVLREGRLAASAPAAALPRAELLAAMVGEERAAALPEVASAPVPSAPAGEPRLEATGLTLAREDGRPLLDRVDVRVARGEVVGVTGLQGSGAELLPYAIFGAVPATGQVAVDGRALSPSPARSIAAGVLLVSGDRQRSVVGAMSIEHNATLSALGRLARGGWVDRGSERREVDALFARLEVRATAVTAPAWRLSGGNQQKVAFARCLAARAAVLLLDEPTRGIDVAAKAEVLALLRAEQARGVAILYAGADVDELMAIAARIVVMVRGRVVAEVERARFSRERIMAAAMGAVA